MRQKTIKRLKRTTAVFLVFFILLALIDIFLLVASALVDRDARTLPSYERVDLSPILAKAKEDWTEEEYETVAWQTGIFARDRLDRIPNDELAEFQSGLYFAGETRHDLVAVTTPHDVLYDPETDAPYYASIVPLEPGDIVLTSTCHTFGWRNGHATLVLQGRRLVQSVSLGIDSEISSFSDSNAIPWFQTASNFMVLRLKDADEETRTAIAEAAEAQLVDIPYSLVVGLFMKKDQGTAPKSTNCSHLVWQAFKNAGYDIDSDGGPICTTRDIANSPLLEVVQIYGFDPAKGW